MDDLVTVATQALPDTQAAQLGKSRWAFPEQECLLHAALWSCQIKCALALGIFAFEVSPVVYQQMDDFHTVLLGGSMERGVQPLTMVNIGS